jgi:predicted RecB family nuclease
MMANMTSTPASPSNRVLSKSKLIAFRQCPKRLWLELHGPKKPAPDAHTQAKFDVGHAVGKIAQTLFDARGKGVVFDPATEGYDEVISRTKDLLQTSRALFEAGFSAAGVRTYVDGLLPLRRGGQKVWRLVEVKSSTKEKEVYLDDIAIQAFILRAAGVPLHSTALVLIDNQWVYPGGGNYQGLLIEVDVTDNAFAREDEVKTWITQAHKVANKRKAPNIDIGSQCVDPYPCAFLDYCQRDAVVPEHPLSLLPGLKSKALRDWIEANAATELRDVPDHQLNAQQLRVKHHTLAGTTFFDAAASAKALAAHKLPAYFLDFESIQMTVPIWKGTRPFQQVLFQFSVHKLSRTGALTHEAFLDLTGKNPSLKIANALIKACGTRGPVFVYSAFEGTRIGELAQRFVKLAPALLAIKARLVDLLPVARDHYYHPDQCGSWSIKSLLPTIAPDLRYDALDSVQNGGAAMLAYMEAIDPGTPKARKDEIEQQLLDYCKLDTLAIVQLWQHFAGRIR